MRKRQRRNEGKVVRKQRKIMCFCMWVQERERDTERVSEAVPKPGRHACLTLR